MVLSFYKGKKVLVTGHTGFKGAWLCHVLLMAGADVTGYALEPPTTPSLFELTGLSKKMNSIIGDVRDLKKLQKVFEKVQPEIVIHMAAQPLVRESYKNPVLTYETNVMGTVNVLECVRTTGSVKSVLNVTTDKVYRNEEGCDRAYLEEDYLNGYDPYSNSKSCSELVTSSYVNSFFAGKEINVAISTARAGNVIGGGDFAKDRIIPDCVRAAIEGNDMIVRNPFSIRPYQHVLEPIMVYLMIAKAQYEDKAYAGCYNVGPDDCDCKRTGELVQMFCDKWNANSKKEMKWVDCYDGGPHEATYLKLDCARLKKVFDWKARWNVESAISKTVEWTREYVKLLSTVNVTDTVDMQLCMEKQILDFLGEE